MLKGCLPCKLAFVALKIMTFPNIFNYENLPHAKANLDKLKRRVNFSPKTLVTGSTTIFESKNVKMCNLSGYSSTIFQMIFKSLSNSEI